MITHDSHVAQCAKRIVDILTVRFQNVTERRKLFEEKNVMIITAAVLVCAITITGIAKSSKRRQQCRGCHAGILPEQRLVG